MLANVGEKQEKNEFSVYDVWEGCAEDSSENF